MLGLTWLGLVASYGNIVRIDRGDRVIMYMPLGFISCYRWKTCQFLVAHLENIPKFSGWITSRFESLPLRQTQWICSLWLSPIFLALLITSCWPALCCRVGQSHGHVVGLLSSHTRMYPQFGHIEYMFWYWIELICTLNSSKTVIQNTGGIPNAFRSMLIHFDPLWMTGKHPSNWPCVNAYPVAECGVYPRCTARQLLPGHDLQRLGARRSDYGRGPVRSYIRL